VAVGVEEVEVWEVFRERRGVVRHERLDAEG
jgi:hypothetical protein